MLNVIKSYFFVPNIEIDSEDFHLGFELALPKEMQELLLGKRKSAPKFMPKSHYVYQDRPLDEHELAIG